VAAGVLAGMGGMTLLLSDDDSVGRVAFALLALVIAWSFGHAERACGRRAPDASHPSAKWRTGCYIRAWARV
jgi:hypothetical protein